MSETVNNPEPPIERYSVVAKVFHWVSALTIFGLFGLGLWMRELDYYDPWYQPAPDLHKSIGMLLVVWILARILWRWKQSTPAPLAHHKPWEVKLAHAVHWLLYLGLFLIFISGYLIATSEGRGVYIFDLFEFPALIPPFDQQEDIAGFIHEWGAYALMAAAALHIAGALKHHFVDKDATLKRML